MFLSRGRTVRIVDAYYENLLRVLSDCVFRYPYSRIVYRGPSGTELQLEIGDRTIVACILVDERGNTYYGDECVDKIVEMGIATSSEGVIEVIELDREMVSLDLEFAPQSRVSESKGAMLLEGLGKRVEERKPETVAREGVTEGTAIEELNVVEEGIDVFTVMKCIAKPRNVEHRFTSRKSCFELIMNVVRHVRGQWNIVYIVCKDSSRVDALLHGENLSVEFVSETKRLTGIQALEQARSVEGKRLSVYYCEET